MTTPPSTEPELLATADPVAGDWRARASCLDLDPDIFFPTGVRAPAPRQARMARRTCRSCPVVADCLDWALRTRQRSGIWGGLNEAERHARIASGRDGEPVGPAARRP